MSQLTIRNAATNENIRLSRDVRTSHPEWVHQQCDTKSEAELQAFLDSYDLDAMARYADKPDTCGVYMTAADAAAHGNQWATIEVGARVEAGEGEDYDRGRVVSIDGLVAEVAWDSGVRTPANVSTLRVL